jgi:bleomycin hydrolase
VCSEKYFEKYVFEAVIDKKYLTKEQKALLKKKPVEIPAWSADWV